MVFFEGYPLTISTQLPPIASAIPAIFSFFFNLIFHRFLRPYAAVPWIVTSLGITLVAPSAAERRRIILPDWLDCGYG